MALTSARASALGSRGVVLPTFVSPNDPRFGPEHNDEVFAE
jgi:hypothetical protein